MLFELATLLRRVVVAPAPFRSLCNSRTHCKDYGATLVDPSSIQVVNGVVYGEIVDRVYALDAKSGRKLWMHSFDNTLNINQSLAVSNGTVYLTAYVPSYGSVASPDTYIYAFDEQTGQQKWVTAKMRGYINAPIALSGQVYVMSYDGIWYTVNASSGAIEAEKTLPARGTSSPVLLNGALYSANDTTLAELNPDGSAKWSVPFTGKYPSIHDVQNGVISISGGGSGISAYRASDGKLLWHYQGYRPQPGGISMVTIVRSWPIS